MTTRRELLSSGAKVAALLAAAGLLPATAQAAWESAAFDAKSLPDTYKALGAATPAANSGVTFIGPDIAENGAVVPVGCACTLPGVKRMMILVEKNDRPLVAVFEVGDAVEANFNTRVKMGQSSNVYAVAQMGDGKVFFAAKEVKVTLGGCGG